MTAYRPRIQWLQGTEVRHTTHSEVFALEEIYVFGEAFADAAAANGAVTFETMRGEWLTLPARSITEIRYQRVEVAEAHRPETTTEQGHCCTEGSPCRNGGGTMAAPLRHVCDTVHVDADEYDACEQRSVELAEQEGRHPGLGQLLDALATQLPPDDPDRCAETLAAMDDGPAVYVSPFKRVGHDGPHYPMVFCPDATPQATYAERTCPCRPGQCTCTEIIEVQGIPFVKGPLHAPHVTDPDQT